MTTLLVLIFHENIQPSEESTEVINKIIKESKTELPLLQFANTSEDVLMNKNSKVYQIVSKVALDNELNEVYFIIKERNTDELVTYKSSSKELTEFLYKHSMILMNDKYQIELYNSK